jgi:hypothetical protein
MSNRIRPRAPTATPIERIFEKVMLRKMNEEERQIFHLKMSKKIIIGNSGDGSGAEEKAVLKIAV